MTGYVSHSDRAVMARTTVARGGGEGRGRGDGDERRAEGRSEGTGTSEGPREGAREGAREEDERRGAEWKFDVYKQRVKATKPTVRRLLYRLAFVAAVPNSAC